MLSSYSLRIPEAEKTSNKKNKKRKIKRAYVAPTTSTLKYKCYQCSQDVYFLPGHELVCAACASRIVEKINDFPKKRIILAR